MEKDEKQSIIGEFSVHKKDSGSVFVQVALLTKRIEHLTQHLQANHHDFHSRRGLSLMVGQRRRLLAYLAKNDVADYRNLIAKLGLRK